MIRLLTEYGLDISLLNTTVWVTDQGSNIISALRPYNTGSTVKINFTTQ